jgi:N-formylmaleamate deformylase
MARHNICRKTARMNNWQKRTVNVNAASLTYYRSGGALPPIVLVHGFTDNAEYFSRVAATLSDSYDVIAYDARGHGTSDRCTAAFDDDLRVNDLVGVIRNVPTTIDGDESIIGLDRPFLLGHSMGGSTIAQTVARHPTISRGAVLEDPAWWEPSDSMSFDERAAALTARRARLDDWQRWVAMIQAMPRDEALALRRTDEPLWAPIDIETSLEGRRAFQLDLFTYFPPERSAWREIVSALHCPTLLLTGDNTSRGRVVSEADATEAAASNPVVDWQVIAGAGHHLKYDQFDSFISAVKRFLEAHT